MGQSGHVSIGQVKRDISDLVNRVVYGGERIVLTSRGKPKAAIVSIKDYEQLERTRVEDTLERWQAWVARSDALAAEIIDRRGGQPLDVDALWDAVRMEAIAAPSITNQSFTDAIRGLHSELWAEPDLWLEKERESWAKKTM